MSDLSTDFVSVIIPVFNDSARLKACLQALEAQTYPQLLYEVVVIDNNSTEDIKNVVNQFAHARIEYETKQGSYAARNKGISGAKGNIFAFTDSDCIPNSDWINQGVNCLISTANCGLVGGKIKFYFKNRKHPTAAELYDSHNSLQQKHYIAENKYGATANVFTFRAIFDRVGLFEQNLKSGGDREWGQRVFQAGYQLVYSEATEVKHPARLMNDLIAKVLRITEGHFILQQQSEIPLFIFLQELYLDFKPSMRFVLKTFRDRQFDSFYQKLIYIYVYTHLRFARASKKAKLYWQYKVGSNLKQLKYKI